MPAIDLSKFKLSDFTDDELDMPYYLKHFHTFANSVMETGPDKGFINIAGVQRVMALNIKSSSTLGYSFTMH